MSPVAEIPCPACRERLLGSPGTPGRCPACGVDFVVPAAEAFVECYAPPRLDAEQAKGAFARLFELDGEPEAGPPECTAELLYVPFVELTGTMVGVAAPGRPVLRWAQVAIPAIDDLDELGIAEIDVGRVDETRAFDRRACGPPASAIAGVPRHDPEDMKAILTEEARTPADGEEVELRDRRFRLIHYPLWRLRYQVRDVVYQATIDALAGAVLHARVPAKQRRRIFLGAAAAACLGYVLGVMLRHPGMGMPGLARAMARASPVGLIGTLAVVVLGAGLYVLLVNAAWNSLRYRNELVYQAGLKTRVLINRPAETLLDQLTGAVKRLWEHVFVPRRFDGP